jgi:aminoglycoside 6-adenylyltransferase
MNYVISGEDKNLDFFYNWIKEKDTILCAILTGSRVSPNSEIDLLSDYDIQLFVNDFEIFNINDDWLDEFGPVLVRWPLKPMSTFDPNWITRLVLFQTGIRFDFQITTPMHFDPGSYDDGHHVLIDKIGLTDDIPPPTFTRFKVIKPSKGEYEDLVNEFWWEITYVAKYLWRKELPAAKYMLDTSLRYSHLHVMMEWYIGLKNKWIVCTGKNGSKFRDFLDELEWKEYKSTFTGPDIIDNWEALFNTAFLFSRLAKYIAKGLGYHYPDETDKAVNEYCKRIQIKPINV